MRGRVVFAFVAVASSSAWASVGIARAQSEPPGQTPPTPAEGAPQRATSYSQEIGAFLGLEGGGRTTPGGLQISGRHLYRLAERDWLDSGVAFTFGSADAACFRDRDGELLCDHGFFEGAAGEVHVGVRRYFRSSGEFTPFARAGVAARVFSFSEDDVRGLALPAFLGGGVRAEVAERVVVVGGASLRAGILFADRDLGLEPHISLSIHGGVEFALD